jgi:hypothetical protein
VHVDEVGTPEDDRLVEKPGEDALMISVGRCILSLLICLINFFISSVKVYMT